VKRRKTESLDKRTSEPRITNVPQERNLILYALYFRELDIEVELYCLLERALGQKSKASRWRDWLPFRFLSARDLQADGSESRSGAVQAWLSYGTHVPVSRHPLAFG
jgi:hypothetical protein